MSTKAKKHGDPMKTKNGNPRLGPLNLSQLDALLESSIKPKVKAKVRNRIRLLEERVKK